MYLKPLKNKMLSLLGMANQSLQDACTISWEIAPAQRQTVPPAIYNPADLCHVTASLRGSTIAREVEKLDGGIHEHASTKAFLLKNVDVVDGFLYCDRWKDTVLPRRAPLLASKPEIDIVHGSLACTWSGNVFFGHWITDDLTLYLAAEATGDPFIVERSQYLHEAEYRQLLGIPRHTVRRVHYHELIVFHDSGQNKYKRRRYDVLRARLKAQVASRHVKRVLLRRGSMGAPASRLYATTSAAARTIINSADVEAYLTSQGFSIVDPENLSPSEIAAQTMGATVVLGVEGSQIPHALLTMAEGGVLCCIQAPSHFNNTIRDYTDCLGMRYSILVGRATEGGFLVDLDDLKLVLEKIDNSIEHFSF